MDFYKGSIPILDTDSHDKGVMADIFHPKNQAKGYVPRDYSQFPQEMFESPDVIQLVPESEYDARYDEQEARKSSLEHVFLPNGQPAFINLNQNGFPDCWAHSTAHAIMIDRLDQNLPVIRLNGVAAATMMNQLQGGWCGLSAKFSTNNGYPVMGTGPDEWPELTRNKKYDTPAMRVRMTKYKITEAWVDLTKQAYDQNLTKAQVATCSFNNIVGPRDYNWWSHSVCGIRWVRIEAGSWGQLILNSWLNFGRFGLAVLRGSQAICNGGLGIRMTTAS